MKEIEVKVLEVDPSEVRKLMDDIGAKKKYDGFVRSRFYDYSDGRIEEDGSLRLRELDTHAFLTRKHSKIKDDDAKIYEEIEFDVSDPEEAHLLLTSIGLKQIEESEKKRIKWKKSETEYVLDKYPGIPWLMEVESPNKEKLSEALNELDYSIEDTVNWGATRLHSHYGLKRKNNSP